MQLVIAERLRPFCHLPGTSTLIPGIGLQVQIFPCLIRFYELVGCKTVLIKELALDLKGPIEQFTVCNDLERGRISVWGVTPHGYFSYYLMSGSHQNAICLVLDKSPNSCLLLSDEKGQHTVQKGDSFFILGDGNSFEPYQVPSCDRLSLGSNKAQDMELIKRRGCLSEILPLWHRLGQLVHAPDREVCNEGTLALLEVCKSAFAENKPEIAQQQWMNLFTAGFRSLFVPRLEDDNYQGLANKFSENIQAVSPLILLTEGARLIRRLFLQQEDNQVAILPLLLPCLSSGRLINVPLQGGGFVGLEWTKKTIRRMTIYLEEDREIFFRFRSDVRRFRVRESTKDKGNHFACRTSIPLRKNYHYLFDNFE